jgi:hypothetical protein
VVDGALVFSNEVGTAKHNSAATPTAPASTLPPSHLALDVVFSIVDEIKSPKLAPTLLQLLPEIT